MAVTRFFEIVTALGKKFFPEDQGPQQAPKGLEFLSEEEQREAIEEFAAEASTLEGGAASLDPTEAASENPFGTIRELADKLGLSEDVKKEFEPEEEQIGGPASATTAPQDPASVVSGGSRGLEEIVQIASAIALDGVPIRGEIKTTGVGSIL